MKKTVLLALILACSWGCKETKQKEQKEATTEDMAEDHSITDRQDDWTVLFDGSSFDGWKGYLQDGVPDTWKLEDGAMVFYPPENRAEGESYNIVTEQSFTDFVLSLEWRISKSGNSGIFWGIREDAEYNQPYETGPEIQVLDNQGHPDAKNGTTHQAGSLYDMVAPSSDVTNPPGEWNTCVITVNHKENKGNVVLNGEEIVSFPVGNDEWNAMVSKSKFADWKGFGKYQTGKIGLQDHHDIVAYRNIKIKQL